MKTPLLKPFDPFLHLIVLFLLSFTSVALFLVLGNGLVNLIWGIDVINNMAMLSDYSQPGVVSANKLLLFLQHLGLFVLPPLIFAPLVSHDYRQYLNLIPPMADKHWFYTVLAMLLSLLPINLLVEWNSALQLPESLHWLEQMMQSAEQQAERLTEALLADQSGVALMVNLMLVAVVPAIGEELMFRGGVQKIITRWSGNYHVGIWIGAVLFSAMHFQFYGFLPRMALGALFGYMLVWSGSIWLPMLAHFINNATAILLHYFISRGAVSPEAETVGTPESGLYYTIISILLLALVLWRWQRSSRWKEIRLRYLGRSEDDSE